MAIFVISGPVWMPPKVVIMFSPGGLALGPPVGGQSANHEYHQHWGDIEYAGGRPASWGQAVRVCLILRRCMRYANVAENRDHASQSPVTVCDNQTDRRMLLPELL